MVKPSVAEKAVALAKRRIIEDSNIWSDSTLRDALALVSTRVTDMADSGVPFFLSILGQPLLLGNAFIAKLISEIGDSTAVEEVPLDEFPAGGRERMDRLVDEQRETTKQRLCFVLSGIERTWNGPSSRSEARGERSGPPLRAAAELREKLLEGRSPPFGAILLLPGELVEAGSGSIRESDLGEIIRLPDSLEIRYTVGRYLLEAIAKYSRTGWPQEIEPSWADALFATGTHRVLTPSLLLERLSHLRAQIVPQKLTKKADETVREVLRELQSNAAKSYPRKRELIQEVQTMGLVDLRPLFSEELRLKMASIESDFDKDLRSLLNQARMGVEGAFPDYRVLLPDSGIGVSVSVLTPYGSLKVNDRSIESPSPRGVLEDLAAIHDMFRKGTRDEMAEEEFSRFLQPLLLALKVGARSEDITIDHALSVAESVLITEGFRPMDAKGHTLRERLRALAASPRVVDNLNKGGWFLHTGKMGGIEVDGKRYTLFSTVR